MFAALLPRVESVIATQSEHPRSIDAAEIVDFAFKFGRPAHAIVPVEKAVVSALQQAGKDTAIVAAGSIFIAAAVREIWLNCEGEYRS